MKNLKSLKSAPVGGRNSSPNPSFRPPRLIAPHKFRSYFIVYPEPNKKSVVKTDFLF